MRATSPFVGRMQVVVLAAVLAVALAGCPSPVLVPPTLSTVTLDVEAVVTGTSDATRIESLHIWPRGAGTSLGFPEDTTGFTVTHSEGLGSDAVPAIARLKGIATLGPLDVLGTGRAAISLGADNQAPMLLEDGFGNALPIDQIVVNFDVFQRGQTNLPRKWALVLPMAGGSLDGTQATFFAVGPQTTVDLSFSMAGAGNNSLTGTTGDAAQDILLAGPPLVTAHRVSQATVSFSDATQSQGESQAGGDRT